MNDTELPDLKRNDACWCGSGKKYKKCHMKTDQTSSHQKPTPPKRPSIHRNKQFIKGMEASCRLAKARFLEGSRLHNQETHRQDRPFKGTHSK